MKKRNYLLFLIGFFAFIFYGFSQKQPLWSATNTSLDDEVLLPRTTSISNFKIFHLETSILKKQLDFTSEIAHGETKNSIVEFPNADGELLKFNIKKSAVLHPKLAAKYPSLKTFTGQGIGNTSTIHLSITGLGLHAMLLSSDKETVFIDPYSKDKTNYMVYSKKDAQTIASFECLTQHKSIQKIAKTTLNNTSNLKLRTFRLALATTEEYSDFHITAAGLSAGSTRNDFITVVLSAITATMTRVNAVFERDIALTMQLVANNDQLLFLKTDPGTDPYTNNDKQAMLTQNQTTLDNIIGTSNYDIGHVFSFGGGGVAYLASTCGGAKAGGVTGSDTPVGDPFDIDYVTHEMGHQYGANHTFNSTADNCGNNNRNANTAVEPGSGSTIMSYAGICAPENVQSHSNAYFHSVSIHEIVNNITTGSSQCAEETNFETNFHRPVADAGNDYTIPKSTPFVLKGEGFDADSNQLTYCWEQSDNEVTSIQIPPSPTQTGGAIFRSFSPSTSPNRYLPSLPTVLIGGNTTWEVLPNIARTLHFNLTVRDNVAGEGQTDTDDMMVTINETGPFIVSSQNTQNLSWTPGGTETITWDVAGTDSNNIDVSHVNILLSLDDGLTFSTVLASNTPNDGQEQIIVPNSTAANVRVLVEAVGNIFYAINNESFSIGSFTTTCTTYDDTDTPSVIPDNNQAGITSTLNILDDYTITNANVTVDISHPWIKDLQIYLQAPNGTEVLLYDRSCGDSNTARENINATFDDDASTTVCLNSNPAISGLTKPDKLLSSLNTLSSFGDWKLKVIDNASGDVGTLNQWSLKFCKTNQTASISHFSMNSIQIFPNPSQSTVQITFNTTSLENITLTLFDTSGRTVFNSLTTNPEPTFTKALNLSDLASGLYILNIQQGGQKTSKKIVKY